MIENLSQPSDRELHDAYDRFRSLLARQTLESDWQHFFRENPFVLSRALPLRLDPREIIPCATPGKSEADFIFYQRMGRSISAYGTIELKRPDSRILTFPRKDIVLLTRDAATALKQAEQYAKSMMSTDDVLFLGCSKYLFIIMGLSSELTTAITRDIAQAEFARLVPPGSQLLPYDELLRRFESTLPAHQIVLVPAVPSDEEIMSSKQASEVLRRDALQRLFSDASFVRRLRLLVRYRLLPFRMSGIDHDAIVDDLVTDILLLLWRHPVEVDNLWPWLARVIRHKVIDYVRTNRASVADERLRSKLDELGLMLRDEIRRLTKQESATQNKRLKAYSTCAQPKQKKPPRRGRHLKTP